MTKVVLRLSDGTDVQAHTDVPWTGPDVVYASFPYDCGGITKAFVKKPSFEIPNLYVEVKSQEVNVDEV